VTARHARWIRLAAVAASAAIGVAAAAGSAQASSTLGLGLAGNLVCEGHVTITFQHPVTDSPAQDTFSETGTLEDCYSPSGSNPNIAKGTVNISGSGKLGCSGIETFAEKATYTWEGVDGNVVGTTTGTGNGTAKDDEADGDIANFARGAAGLSSTRFALQEVEGSFEPQTFTGTCSAGITKLSGTSTVDIGPGDSVGVNLVCEGSQTVAFSSPVTGTPTEDSYTAAGDLTDCESPSGTNPGIASGTVSIAGYGQLSCTGIDSYAESVVYTWKDANGNVVGFTTGTGQGTAKNGGADGDLANYVSGNADPTSSRFALQQVAGSIEPRSETGNCATGITGWLGVSQVSISAL
jgi:hypothetical protein